MTKNEFLWELKRKLHGLPQSEIDNAINYYEEYFDDAGVENEQQIIAELGSPSIVASKIIGEYAINDANHKEKGKGTMSLLLIVLMLFAAPIALPVALAFGIVGIAVIFAIAVTFGALIISGIAVAVSGIFAIVAGFIAFTSSFASGLYFIGYGLFIIVLSIAIVIGIVKLSKITFLGIQKLIGLFLVRRSER